MKEVFREYHQFTADGYRTLLDEALFVFDTNTLLNMYRYSRPTVKNYVKVLKKLKKKQQIWIPYQVGYEFYENRLNVINEYKNSYDNILTIIDKTKNDIKLKYKDHPFLDMHKLQEDIAKSLEGVEKTVRAAKDSHPDWTRDDDVLKDLNALFKDCVGAQYGEATLNKIYEDGKDRYANRIPPGFKDSSKPEPNRYGDLVVWYQIIDKAREVKKPIVFVSGDIKEDWWLLNNGERLMPLPRLKKEMLSKADVDFHIYTADKFLELHQADEGDGVSESTIEEVRKVLELEELRMSQARDFRQLRLDAHSEEEVEFEHSHMRMFDILQDLPQLLRQMEHLSLLINEIKVPFEYSELLVSAIDKIKFIGRDILEGGPNKIKVAILSRRIYEGVKSLQLLIDAVAGTDPESKVRLRVHSERMRRLRRRLSRYTDEY